MSTNNDFWQKVSRAVGIGKRKGYITLPAFTQSATWRGVSLIQLQFNYAASKHVTLQIPEKPDNVNFCLCVKYRVGDTVYRYKLWENVGEVLYFPLYNGEVIKKNFTLEIWNTENAASVDLQNALTINMSTRQARVTLTDSDIFEDTIGVKYTAFDNINTAPLTFDKTGIQFWYKSDAGVLTTGNVPAANFEAVTKWQDQSGLGVDLLTVAGSLNPIYDNGAIEIGLDKGLKTATSGFPSTTVRELFLVVGELVVSPDARIGGSHAVNFSGGATSDKYQYKSRIGGAVVSASYPTSAGTTPYVLHFYVNDATPAQSVVNIEARTALTELRASNNANSGTIDGINEFVTTSHIFVGAAAGSSGPTAGKIYEMVGFSSLRTNAQRETIFRYLTNRYHIPGSNYYGSTAQVPIYMPVGNFNLGAYGEDNS